MNTESKKSKLEPDAFIIRIKENRRARRQLFAFLREEKDDEDKKT